MSKSRSRPVPLAAIGLVASVSLAVPPASASESITLRVPVQMKEMVATGVKVDCEIFGDNSVANLAKKFNTADHLFQIVDGEFDQVVEVVLTPEKPGGFVGAKSYRCAIKVLPDYTNTYHATHATPEVGSPGSGAPIFKLARPDRFFRAAVTGQLAGTPLAGAKDLQQTPKPPVGNPKTIQVAPKTLKQ